MPIELRLRFDTTSTIYGSGSVILEQASIQPFWIMITKPDIGACGECGNGPNLWEERLKFGAMSVSAQRSI